MKTPFHHRRHHGRPTGADDSSGVRRMTQTVAVAAVVFLITGCALNKPTYTEWDATTGKMTKRLTVPSIAFWPATTSLEKQRVSIGKTMSVGTAGLNEDGGSTNIAATLEALTKLLQTLK